MASWGADGDLRLGRYTLKRPLGEGGNGQVFLAWQDNEAGEPLVCVVKFPLQRLATDVEGRERFIEEARIAMRLGAHANIVQVIDVGRHEHMPFIAMEYVDGTDLRRLLKQARAERRPFPLSAVYAVLGGAAAGLHHAHAGATVARKPVGIVHRDIKPGNILVTRDGLTKLADFGISTTLDEGTSGKYMRGTYRYMSPEHISSEVRPEMDIYSLGVVAWEMVENRAYREGYEGTQHISAIMDGDVPAFQNKQTPRELVSLIEACLEPNPRQRPRARELLGALEGCPGFVRYSSELLDVISTAVGAHRSSGRTLQEFLVTPELAATFAALKIAKPAATQAAPTEPSAPEPADRPSRVEGPPPPRWVAPPARPVPPPSIPAPPRIPEPPNVAAPASVPEPPDVPVPAVGSRAVSDAITVQRAETDERPHPNPEPDAPRFFRRRRRKRPEQVTEQLAGVAREADSHENRPTSQTQRASPSWATRSETEHEPTGGVDDAQNRNEDEVEDGGRSDADRVRGTGGKSGLPLILLICVVMSFVAASNAGVVLGGSG